MTEGATSPVESAAPDRSLEAAREGAAALAALVRTGRAAEMPDDDLRLLLTSAVAACSACWAARGCNQPFDGSVAIDRTDVLRVVDQMLTAMDLEPFEVSMWRSWGGG